MGPTARSGHALAYDASKKRTLLVGGDGFGLLFRDSWLWDGELWTQVEDIGPSGRTGHAVAYASARSRVVLFGGLSASGELGDTWEWDGGSWTQLEDTGPSARARHALAYDSTRSRVVLFGGESAGGLLGDTWEWNGDEWTQVADTGPSPRRGHAMCFESPANWTVLFGGSNGSDTWAWNGTGWTELNDIGPPPSEGMALAYTGQSTLLFGGLGRGPNASLSGLTWELVGPDWAERQDIGPTPRFGHAMVYDGTRGRVVLFGGSGAFPVVAGSLFGDTWELPAGGQTAPGMAKLAVFGIYPSSAPVFPHTMVQFSVELESPAPATVEVPIYRAGVSGWVEMLKIPVAAGAAVGTKQVSPPVTPGVHEFKASLGGHDDVATLEVYGPSLPL